MDMLMLLQLTRLESLETVKLFNWICDLMIHNQIKLEWQKGFVQKQILFAKSKVKLKDGLDH